MKKLLALILSINYLCVTAHALTSQQYIQIFKNYEGCFILYNLSEDKIVSEYNPKNRCSQQISPDSTFKIALSLMGFDQGVINQDTIFKWDGKKAELPGWNQDQTPNSWLKYSVVWVSQQITPLLGYGHIKDYLADFKYGNQDFSGDPGKSNGLHFAWLSSSLKISAVEQLHFLKEMLTYKLAISHEAINHTKKNLYLGKLANGADYYGKTGSGRHGRNEREANPSRLRDGWFVGFIESNHQQYIFVSNLTDKRPVSFDKSSPDAPLKPYGGVIIKPLTIKILNDYFKS